MSDLDMETRIVSMTAPTVPAWAVFTAAEEGDDEVWTARVHLWAHTRNARAPDVAEEEELLRKEVPKERFAIQGMVVCEGEMVLVSDTCDWLFVKYSESETPRNDENLRFAVKLARRRSARQIEA